MNVQTTEHRTRAQVMRDKVAVRLAIDECGPAIETILRAHGIEMSCAKVFPHWLIATVEDEVIGCIQVLPANPVGYLNFLYVAGSNAKLKAIAMRKLILAGLASMSGYGCAYVCCNIDTGNRFMDVARRLNFAQVNETALMMKRLTDG